MNPSQKQQRIILSYGQHRGNKVLWVDFTYNKDIVDQIKAFGGRWSQSKKKWYILKDDFNLHHFFVQFKGVAWVDYSALKEGKSTSAEIKSGTSHDIKVSNKKAKKTLEVNCNEKEIDKNAGELVKEFLQKQVLESGYGRTSQNQALSALQNYYRIVYHIDLHTETIPRPKHKQPLPKVLSENEFVKMYSQCNNEKHQIILKLMYGCGLRRNEVCNLKTEDVNIERELIFVKGKGGKYRAINPGRRLIEDIKSYVKNYKPEAYFIEGQTKGKYSGSSIEKIVKRLAEKAGLKRHLHPHMLRHTFATHHMEKGTELRLIQEALGHASSKTTEIYTKVSRKSIKKMRNLLDDMEI